MTTNQQAKLTTMRPAAWNGEDIIGVCENDRTAFNLSSRMRARKMEDVGGTFVERLSDPSVAGGMVSLVNQGWKPGYIQRAIALNDQRCRDRASVRKANTIRQAMETATMLGLDLVQSEIAAGVRDFDGELLERFRDGDAGGSIGGGAIGGGSIGGGAE